MAPELRKTGIGVVGDMPWGTHLCHFYETKEDLLDILIPYFSAGLENNEFCMWVVSEPLSQEEARKAFRQAVREADRYLSAGHIEIAQHALFPASQQTSPSTQIEIVPHAEWYLKGGAFVAERVIKGWNEKLAAALAEGYDGMRANGNEAWLTDENRKDFFHYERTLDEELAGQRMIVLCSYPLSGSSAGEIFDVAQTHQLAVLRRRGNWEVVETPELREAKAEVNRLNKELEQRVVERTSELAATNEALQREIARRRQAEDGIRLIIDTIPVMAWSLTPDGIVDFLNQRWLDYAGLSFEQYVADPSGPVHPSDFPRALEYGRAQMALGEGYDDEVRLRRADGEYRWFLVRTAPLRDESGKVIKWFGVSIDIEDRKRAEEALRQSQQLLQLVLATLPVGVSVTDRAGEIVLVNTASKRIWGDIIVSGRQRWAHTKGFWHGSGKRIAPTAWASVRALSEGQTSLKELIDIETYDGQQKTIENSVAPIRNADELIVGAVIVNEDVTERVQAEEQLKATTEHLRALSARMQSAREEESTRIARELHDQLGGALTSLRWDLEEFGDLVPQAADSGQLAVLRQKIEAMMALTDTTLDTVRRLSSELRPMILDELGLVEAFEWQALQFEHRTGTTVQFECSVEKIDLNGEQSTAVFRILQEALTNILRHAQATKVAIMVKQDDGEFFLTVEDNGKGITEKEQSDAHSLGLLGMRERAHLIGAKIDITGMEGKGTLVSVRIPMSIP
jgi:PAS domain S-box-containing protein